MLSLVGVKQRGRSCFNKGSQIFIYLIFLLMYHHVLTIWYLMKCYEIKVSMICFYIKSMVNESFDLFGVDKEV